MKGKAKSVSKRGDPKLGVKKGGRKAAKDPNKPKRPPSAFFVFMEEFRKQFKEKNPNNKSVAAVGKAAGAEWKNMTDEDKAPYVEKAEKRKRQYEKDMNVYNNKQDGVDVAEEESDKSKSEVNDEDDDDASGEEDDDE